MNLVYEYELSTRWVIADIVLRQDAGLQLIEGLHARQLPDSQEHLNAFTVRGKTVAHYLFLAWALVVPIFIVSTLLMVFRTKGVPRRWLWALFVAVGVGQVAFNWTTGQVAVQMIHVTLFGAGFFKGYPYAPLLLFCSFSVGAVMFLRRRRSWGVDEAAPVTAVQE